jgi:hypothetical protein
MYRDNCIKINVRVGRKPLRIFILPHFIAQVLHIIWDGIGLCVFDNHDLAYFCLFSGALSDKYNKFFCHLASKACLLKPELTSVKKGCFSIYTS